MTRKIHAVFFDLDCTLTDRQLSLVKSAERLLQQFPGCIEISPTELARHMHRFDEGGYRPRAEFFSALIQELKWSRAPAIDSLVDFWRHQSPKCAVAVQGMTDLLKDLRRDGYRLGIITNGSPITQDGKVDALNLRDMVDVVLVSGRLGIDKPDPRIFQTALQTLSVQPHQSVLVGDHPLCDVLGAQSVGMHAIWIPGNIKWPPEHPAPKWTLNDLRDLPTLLQQM